MMTIVIMVVMMTVIMIVIVVSSPRSAVGVSSPPSLVVIISEVVLTPVFSPSLVVGRCHRITFKTQCLPNGISRIPNRTLIRRISEGFA
jgi:hypothetical protein